MAPADAPVLMLSNSLGSTLHMWDPQAKASPKNSGSMRYDGRGHGKSGAPKGPYSIELLGRDAMAVMDHLGLKKVNWLGLSMGGMIGQWLGANAADRIDKLILSNTSSHYADKTPWDDRIKAVRAGGVKAICRPGDQCLAHQGFPGARTEDQSRHDGDDDRDAGRGLCRLLRGDPRHGPARRCSDASRRRRW